MAAVPSATGSFGRKPVPQGADAADVDADLREVVTTSGALA